MQDLEHSLFFPQGLDILRNLAQPPPCFQLLLLGGITLTLLYRLKWIIAQRTNSAKSVKGLEKYVRPR
jgi:hypothetical protein